KPYHEWLANDLLPLSRVPYTGNTTHVEKIEYRTRQKLFGYTIEDISTLIAPMAKLSKEAIGSMGADIPLAVFSDKPQLLFNYFKQLFAQVTNPPLDGIREEIVTDISLSLGEDRNLFEIIPEQCRRLLIQNPVISNEDLDKIKYINKPGYKAASVSILYEAAKGLNGLELRLDEIIDEIKEAVDEGCNILILSDRNLEEHLAPIPSLLACSFVHHMVKKHNIRSSFEIVIESAEPREPHHFALLFGYGASAVNPYMVNEIIYKLVEKNEIEIDDPELAVQNFITAIGKGILKIMNKIGIS